MSKINNAIVLSEHDTWHGFEDGKKIKINDLKSEDSTVLDELEKQYNVKYSFNKNSELKIESNNFIGSVQLENLDCRINVVPKMFKDKPEYWIDTSVFLFFANNVDIKKFLEDQKNFFESGSDHLINPLHIDLIHKCKKLMNKGLLKSYVENRENTSALRGKILLQHQMNNDLTRNPKFFCEYDELEYDSIENRVILEALTVIERTSDNPRIRMKSMDLAQRLSGVVKKTSVPRLTRKRMMQSYNRQNLRYQRIHQVCDQIIDKSGIDDIYRGENTYVIPVFYDMNELFESFIQKLFQWCYKHEDLKVETQFSEKAWTGQGELGNRSMRPDITIWNGKICENIIDVKYKTKDISTGDLYQLGFYMHEFSEKYNPTQKQIKNAIALTPEFTDAKSGMYESITGKQVFVKRIDVEACLDIMKTSNWDSLKPEIKSWIEPTENLN